MTNKFETAIARLDGYLTGLSMLCHRTNYVPLYKAMAGCQSTGEITVDVQTKITAISLEYGFNEGFKCSSFQLVSDWETALENAINKWVFKHLLGGSSSIQSNKYLSLSLRNTVARLRWLIRDIIEPNEPEVWRFQIGLGCHYNWGFDNESYAFTSDDKLFILTFGWAD